MDIKVGFLAEDKGVNNPPKYYHESDAAFDLQAAENFVVIPKSIARVNTGFHIILPEGYELQVRSRSGLAHKHGISVTNSPGTIDSLYTGEIIVALTNHGGLPYYGKRGDRIAQCVIAPTYKAIFEEVSELPKTERGQNGIGSTGR